MAERRDQDRPEGSSSEEAPSVFDLFEPPPPSDPKSFGKVPVIKDAEIDLTDGASLAEMQAAADAEAAGLQHWTAPPTGQLPAVLSDKESKAGLWGDVAGPSWHGDDPTWSGPDLADVFADTDSIRLDDYDEDDEDEDDEYRRPTAPQTARTDQPAPVAPRSMPQAPAPERTRRPEPDDPAPPLAAAPERRTRAGREPQPAAVEPTTPSDEPSPGPGDRGLIAGEGSQPEPARSWERSPAEPAARQSRSGPPGDDRSWPDAADGPRATGEHPAVSGGRILGGDEPGGPRGGESSAVGASPALRRDPTRQPDREGSGPARPRPRRDLLGAEPRPRAGAGADPRARGARAQDHDNDLPPRAPQSELFESDRTVPSISDIEFADPRASGEHRLIDPGMGHEAPGFESIEIDPDYYDEPAPRSGGRNVPVAVAVGAALVAILLGATWLGPEATLLLVVVLALLAVVELYNAMRLAGLRPATLLGIVGTAAAPVAAFYRGDAALPLIVGLTVVFGSLWYLVGADTERPVLNLSLTMMGVFWVGGLAAFAGLMLRFEDDLGIDLLLAAIIITVVSDTMAYVGGRAYGRKPFHPVSPNKTWEGTITGFLGAVFAGFVIGVLELGQLWEGNLAAAVALGAVVGVLAPVGDLTESLVKRDLGVKDMGHVLPGHGGVLDRVDALLFALPGAYYLALVSGLI